MKIYFIKGGIDREKNVIVASFVVILVIVTMLYSLNSGMLFKAQPTPTLTITTEPTPAPTLEPTPTLTITTEPTLEPTLIKTLAPTPKATPAPTVKPKPKATAKPVVAKPALPAPEPVVVVVNNNYIKTLLVEHSLETFYTNNNSIYNSSRALGVINGYILRSGQTFSFNGVVGNASYENGYKKAPFSVGSGPGGGICSASTAVFQTAREAGLEIIERWNHSKEGHYASFENDAAIDYGSKNMRFSNNTESDLLIECGMSGTVINVRIYKLTYN